MDFLDSIDVYSTKSVQEHTHRKARRVRSWYLYEQFKALEKHQMEATQNLKDRLYHGPHLHEELRERRERRRLVDEFSMSDSGIDRFSSDIHIGGNDSFRSFSDFHDVPFHDINQIKDTDTTSLEESQDYSNQTEENIRTMVDATYDCNYKYDVTDVVETRSIADFTKTITYGTEDLVDASNETNLADDIKESLEYARKIIAENINLQLDTVKENIQCLEEFTKLHDDDVLATFDKGHKHASVTSLLQNVEKFCVDYQDASVTTSLKLPVEKCDIELNSESVTTFLQDPVEKCDVEHKDASATIFLQDSVERFDVDHEDATVTMLLQSSVETRDNCGMNLYSMWAKFVSFAYQLVKLNHGSCYYEYSSQVLTAILACDILCRGLHRLCNILQPYVSPIKYTAEDNEPQPPHKRDTVNIERRRKIPAIPTKVMKSIKKKASKKLRRSVWKNMSTSPIIFHVCGDTRMECCRHNSNNDIQHPTSNECPRNSNIHTRRPTLRECQCNSNNDTWCPASSSRNFINDTRRATSNESRCNFNNDIWRATSSECRYNSTNDTRCPTSSECRRNSNTDIWRATSSECRLNFNNDIRRSTLNELWLSLPRTSLKESSTEKSTSTLWPEELRLTFSKEDAFTNCRKVTNPMLKLANYIDTLLKDVGDNL